MRNVTAERWTVGIIDRWNAQDGHEQTAKRKIPMTNSTDASVTTPAEPISLSKSIRVKGPSGSHIPRCSATEPSVGYPNLIDPLVLSFISKAVRDMYGIVPTDHGSPESSANGERFDRSRFTDNHERATSTATIRLESGGMKFADV